MRSSLMKLATLILVCFIIPALADVRHLQISDTPDNTMELDSSTNSTNPTNTTGFANITEPIDFPHEPNTTFVDQIIIPFYRSSLSSQQRNDYDYWIRYKNSFNSAEGQLAKLTKYFAPEETEYYFQIFKSGWSFYAFASLVFLFFLIYIISRFCCRKFMGPKAHITIWFGVWTWFLFGKVN